MADKIFEELEVMLNIDLTAVFAGLLIALITGWLKGDYIFGILAGLAMAGFVYEALSALIKAIAAPKT